MAEAGRAHQHPCSKFFWVFCFVGFFFSWIATLHFSSTLKVKCGHVTKFWPIVCEPEWWPQFSGMTHINFPQAILAPFPHLPAEWRRLWDPRGGWSHKIEGAWFPEWLWYRAPLPDPRQSYMSVIINLLCWVPKIWGDVCYREAWLGWTNIPGTSTLLTQPKRSENNGSKEIH